MTESSLEQHLTAARREHLVEGREIHLEDVRGQGFCEVGLVTGTGQEDAVANIWSTAGVCDPTPDQFYELDADTIARENQALHAWLNPVRHWMFDRLDVREAGDDKTFGSITGTWIRAVDAATLTEVTHQASYERGFIHGDQTFTFSAGSKVYLLDAPDGEVFIMHSASRPWDPTVQEGDFSSLHIELDLPEQWGFRTETLDEDLEVSSNPDKLAHVVQDNLHNIYLGSDLGRAFGRFVPEDSLR